MAKKEPKKGFFRFMLDVNKWADTDKLADNARFIGDLVANLKRQRNDLPDGYLMTDTFDEVMQMLNMTAEDVKRRAKYFLYCFIIYFTLSAGLFAYAIYLAYNSSKFLAALTCLVLALVMLIYSLREHFWYMQMQTHKLGCGFKDWMNFIFQKRMKYMQQ